LHKNCAKINCSKSISHLWLCGWPIRVLLLFPREFSFHFLASLLFAQKLSLIINLVSHNMCGTCNDFTYLFKPHLLFSNVCSMLLLCIWKFGKSQKRSSYYWKKHSSYNHNSTHPEKQ
jgi:hypothetical protein